MSHLYLLCNYYIIVSKDKSSTMEVMFSIFHLPNYFYNMNTSDKHFQQLALQQISELLPRKQMQIHNNYKLHNNINTSEKHFQQLLLQQIA